MRTNRQALKEAIESGAVQAWIEGKSVDVKYVDASEFEKFGTAEEDFCPNFQSEEHQWRPSPIKKLRPWKAEEVPLGAHIRPKGEPEYRSLIISAGPDGLDLIDEHGSWQRRNYAFFLRDGEYSVDNGQTWLPCGVEE